MDYDSAFERHLQSQTKTLDSSFLLLHPPAQCCFVGSKRTPKKSPHHCRNIERGEAGEGFLLRVARDFWLGLYSLYMLGISMGLFQACNAIVFEKDVTKAAKFKQTLTTTGNHQ